MILKGELIDLVSIEISDVNETYLSWLNDKSVMKGIATSGYTLNSLRDYVKEKISHESTVFKKIIFKENNLHIGNVKLDFHDGAANTSELGILIGEKEYWGKGLATEACRLILNYAFHVQGLRKVWLAVYENNPGAKFLYEKIGFRVEGCMRKHVFSDGLYLDKYIMGIFKEEFK